MLTTKRKHKLGRLKRRKDASGLAAAAQHRDLVEGAGGDVVDLAAPIRLAALVAMTELPRESLANPDVLPAAAACLGDPSREVAAAAVRVLVACGSPEAREVLVVGVADQLRYAGHTEARSAALEILAGDGERAVAALARALIRRQDDLPLASDDAEALRFLLMEATGSPSADHLLIGALVEELRVPDLTERGRAEQILRWFARDAVESLLAALGDPELRGAAAGALGAAGDASTVPALADHLTDPDPEIRRRVARALGEIMSPRAVEPLLRATDDEDYGVRTEAVDALDQLGTLAVVVGIETLARREAPALDAAVEPRVALEGTVAVEPLALEQPQAERVRAVARDGFATGRPLWPGLRRVLESKRTRRRAWDGSDRSEPEPAPRRVSTVTRRVGVAVLGRAEAAAKAPARCARAGVSGPVRDMHGRVCRQPPSRHRS